VHNLLIEAGFVLHRNRKHPIYQCPCGHAQLTGCCSGYRGKGDTNLLSQMTRTLRVCNENMKAKVNA